MGHSVVLAKLSELLDTLLSCLQHANVKDQEAFHGMRAVALCGDADLRISFHTRLFNL